MAYGDPPAYFDNPEVWNPVVWQNFKADHMRAKLAGEWLPANVRSILDVGCGNGVFTNLAESGQVKVGVDLSKVALLNVTAPRVLASADHLPFASRCFDAIVCMEMLEHLSSEQYRMSLNEIQRVSGRYVLITVPFEERLEYYQVICPACLHLFHPYHHLRSFIRSDFGNLLGSGYQLEILEAVIVKKVEAFPALWNMIRSYLHRKGRNFPGYTVCPQCGYRADKEKIAAQKKKPVHSIRSLVGRWWPKKSTFIWWMALYKRMV
jgi:SAM-dependent methyltransferase